MSDAIAFPAGGFRFAPGVFQYSAGVAAEPGFRIERARFARPLPLKEGFDRIAAHLASLGRPTTAFCACELRSPEPFTEAGFQRFNEIYVGTLTAWGLFDGRTNPVARSNVCPEIAPPPEPSFFAFCYTMPAAGDRLPTFVVAGSGEAPEGQGNYKDHAVAPGDTSPEGLRQKARWVLAEMERRQAMLGATWQDVTSTQLYTIYDPHPFMGDELVRRGAMAPGLTWHFARPPVAGLDYEMDCRGISVERVLAV